MYEQRKQLLNNIIDHHELGALIFWRPDELVMTTGYLPNWGLSFLVCTKDEPVLIVPELEPEDILPREIAIETFPWGMLDCSNPWQILFGKIKNLLCAKGLQHLPVSFIRYIGGTAPCMMAGEQPPLPFDLIEQLSSVSNGGYKDISADLLALYAFKTSSDIAALELTHSVASLGVSTFYEQVKTTGKTEAAIAAAVEAVVQSMTGKSGVHFAKAWAMVQSGINTQYGGRYNKSSGRELADGEMVMLEMAVCVNGYWADITRTATTTETSSEQNRVINTVKEAQKLAISYMKPGVSMQEIDALARTYISKAGFGNLFNHALGHQTGFRYHDPGAALSPSSTAILKEGMVLTVEPGIYGKEIQCGARIEDNVLITADGCTILSNYP